ncbi:MAG TPA: type II and III secretion system protein, partial [Longimicrobiales bacterium]|nr:type II and III secretion system protein [Longimicrobiales bacterium]
SLGGNSVAALGNANNRVVGPTLTLLSSLLVGRHTLLAFVEALESANLSDIQAVPSLTVADNNTARIQVGEQTPLRVVDASAGGGAAAGGGGGAALPTASVEIQETGIILEATPHVTSTNNILLDLRAERSAPRIAESDVGFIFDTQNAQTRVLLENGETVVIGGLTVTEQSEVRSGIPLLMNLPLVGRLFRVTRESQVQRDLIILVTPHIVGAD